MKTIILSVIFFLILNHADGTMANSKIIQKVNFYSEKENIEQVDTIAAVMRIIAGEAVFKNEELVLRDVKLHYPKNQNLPITAAFAKSKVSFIEFERVNDNVNWHSAIVYSGRGKNDDFDAHLPNLNSKDLDRLKLKFIKSAVEDVEDNDQTDNNGKIRYHKAHMFYYVYTPRTGSAVDVKFEVEKNIYKLGDDCPKHFSSVLITRRR